MSNQSFNLRHLRHLALPLLLVLFLVFQPLPKRIDGAAESISDVIATQYKLFESIADNAPLVNECFSGKSNFKLLNNLEQQHFGLFFYRSDSLVFWTKNSAIPFGDFSTLRNVSLQKLQNGWYIVFKKNISAQQLMLGLLPLKFDFNPQSTVLKNSFYPLYKLSYSEINIGAKEDTIANTAARAVKAPDGTTLFFIQKVNADSESSADHFSIVLFLLIILGVGIYFHRLVAWVFTTKGVAASVALAVFGFMSFYAVLYGLKQNFSYFLHEFFQPELYSSGFTFLSLFDLLLLSGFVLWMVSFYTTRLGFAYTAGNAKWKRCFYQFLLMLSVYGFSMFIAYAIKTLVLDSAISFQLFNLLNLSIYSFVGLLCVALLMFTHFLISSKAIKLINGIALPVSFFVVFGLVLAVVFSAVFVLLHIAEIYIAAALWTTAWLFIFMFVYQESFTLKRISNLLIIVGMYSVLATYLFENLFEVRERNLRKLVAETLLQERDYFTESNFEATRKAIEADTVIAASLTHSKENEGFIKEKLLSEYLTKYLNKYNASVYFSDTLSANEYTWSVQKYGTSKSRFSSLKFVTDSSGYGSYVALLFQHSGTPFAIELKPRIYETENLYNRLLADNYMADKVSEEGFSYAVYRGNKLLVQRGDYSYPLFWKNTFDFKGEREQFIDVDNWEHNILKGENQKKVIVTVKQESLFEPIALLSYIFTFFLLFILLVQLAASDYKIFLSKEAFLRFFYQSFKARLNYAMFFIIVTSFIAIGYITITFFSEQYNGYLSEKAVIKEKAIVNALNFSLSRIASFQWLAVEKVIVPELEKNSFANNADVNFFDDSGNLVYTSQAPLFERGIISKKINPEAFIHLRNSNENQINISEQIGALSYRCSYYKLQHGTALVGFLAFPYFESSLTADDEISSFLIALLNVYVFLLIGAIVVSYFISKSVTRPLNFIAEKMQIVNLSKRNELIEWNSRDEIGVLVRQYNRMIRELENSAEQLARTERESAWREMAKQIAHEIKNPLTPMKLSIQYLQKAIDEKNPRVHELAAKVTQTLVEQIDNLSAIATSFSSFAKMPKGENEAVDLNIMLQGICELFGKEENVSVSFTTSVEKPMVFADKNQLLSVFNNLVKNGIQSVPESQSPTIDIAISEQHEMIQVKVIDNGIGISEENYSKVFVPNFTTKSSGTGLGLAIALQIIEGAGGAIWFESVVGQGTSFFVVLPKMK
ncbi:MAG: HAMP domain-containing sensor histidine kinase [Chitinophagales bacterium]